MQFRTVAAAEILALRHAVLRPGLPAVSAHFEGDDAADTAHFGAFWLTDNVGCLSLMSSSWEGRAAWQLRGMATRPAWRGRGVGSGLLRWVLSAAPARPVWCNARVGAVAFYERHGFSIVSERFEIPEVGPHYRMSRDPDVASP